MLLRGRIHRNNRLGRWGTLSQSLSIFIPGVVFLAVAVSCSPTSQQPPATGTPSSNLAEDTAIVTAKYTREAELTRYPIMVLDTQAGPIPTMVWTPSPGDVTAADSGNSVDIWITTRVSVILDESQYPRANLNVNCIPEDALAFVSNLPDVPPNYYVVRYEGFRLGQCVIRNGQFHVVFDIINRP